MRRGIMRQAYNDNEPLKPKQILWFIGVLVALAIFGAIMEYFNIK